MFRKGDLVLVITGKGDHHLLRLEGGMQKVPGLGVLDASTIIDKEPGYHFALGDEEMTAVRPTIADRVAAIKRGAQIISLKDSSNIALGLDVRSGSTVVEGGSGSGAMTMVLAHLVRPDGKVVSYDLREDFSKNARRNLERGGLDEYVEFKLGDVTKGIEERGVDAFFIDIPNPWEAVATASGCLRPGGMFGSYSPNISQLERTVKELRGHGFQDIRSLEILERDLLVGERGTRPSTEMLGHTGYITIARKVR